MRTVTDVRTELRRIADRPEFRRLAGSKPVHAAAGAGVVASETLRELPARLAKWRTGNGMVALEQRATGYVTEVRTRAVKGYDHLALRGKRVMNGKPAGSRARTGKTALDGKATKTSKTSK